VAELPDYNEISSPFDQEWISGPAQIPQSDVPLVYPCSIAGHPYQIDLSKLRMTTMQVRRVALDDSVEPGEQSLNAAGVWPRAQDNWFLGAGQLFLDNRFAFETIYTHTGEAPSVRTRFWRSKGVYINQEGNLSLQPAQILKYASVAQNCQVLACGSYVYVVDGVNLYWTDDPTPGSPNWIGPVGGGAAHNITDITTDGSRVWVACGQDGIYVTSQGTTTWSRAARPAALTSPTGTLATVQSSGVVSAFLLPSVKYTYSITAVDSFGNETNVDPSSGSSTVTSASPATPVLISWNGAPVGQNPASYNIYRSENGGHNILLGNELAATPSWTDYGQSVPVYQAPPQANHTGSNDYAATGIWYCSGYLIGSTGPDLVNILANGTAQFIYEHPATSFVFTFAFSTPTAIHVGGSANGQSFIGAIQPDSQTQGANLAPPYTASVLPIGEVPYAFAYNAGSIVMATSAGIRTGTAPDSTGVFDINPCITDAAPVLCLAAWQNYCYYGWSNFNIAYDQPGIPDPDVFTSGPTVSGLGKLDLSQYTALGVPVYATDAMVADTDSAGIDGQPAFMPVTSVTIAAAGQTALNGSTGLPFFSVQGAGVYGPSSTAYVPSGWVEAGWTRYSTLEPKILCRADVLHEPLAIGTSVELDIFDEWGNKSVGGISKVPDTTGPGTYFQLDRQVGNKFMPVITLYANAGQSTPVLHEWVIYGMVVPIRQDEWMLPIRLFSRVNDLTAGGGQPHYQDTFAEFLFLKQLEASGTPVNVEIGGLTQVCYIDQIQVSGERDTAWNDLRTFPETTVVVKVITLGPIGQPPSGGAGDE
jgi:hypothetical protein